MAYPVVRNAPPPLDTEDEVKFRNFIDMLVRSRRLVLGTALAVVLLAALMLSRTVPVYESSATLRIDEAGSNSFLTELAPVAALGGGSGALETEVAVLRSRQIAEAVVDSLKLPLQVSVPGRTRDEVIRVVTMGRDVVPGSFELERGTGQSYTVQAEGVPTGVEVPRRVSVGESFRIGSTELVLSPDLARDLPETIRFSLVPFRRAVETTRRDMVISRPDPKAQLVEIRFRNTDPSLAAAVPNVTSTAFIAYKARGSQAESSGTVDFLREQVKGYAQELRGAEEDLRTFREREQLVSITDEASVQVRRLAELQARHEALLSEREALGELLQKTAASSGTDASGSAYRQLTSFPVFFANQGVQNILQSLTELENQRAQLLIRRTPDNEEVRGINDRIRELERELYQIAINYQRSLESESASVEASLQRFGAQISQIPAREIEFARLSRQQSLLSDIYTLLQTRLKDAELTNAVTTENVRPIDPALVPEEPVSPRPLRTMVFAVVGGLILGIGAAAGRSVLDTKVRTEHDAQQASGGIPLLATIPRMTLDSSRELAPAERNWIRVGKILPSATHDGGVEGLIATRQPQSPAAEAFRSLRTSITFATFERPARTIVLTSATPGDGKSTSAANLAIAFAQQGLRTLLVDADLRRGVLHRVFDLPQDTGLTHVLLGKTSVDEAIHRGVLTGSESLDFLPVGIFPPNPAELVGSSQMRALIEDLRNRYDIVLFDTPPVNLVVDAGIIGALVDTTLLVARAGATDKRALTHAAARLHQLGAPLGGLVLNDFTERAGGYQYASAGSFGGYLTGHVANGNGHSPG
jgi:capsular exopolysaccharide synthesis family protein